MYDLNNYLDSQSLGWTVSYAEDINANGWIAADANGHAVILVPVPEPSTIVLLGFGVAIFMTVGRFGVKR